MLTGNELVHPQIHSTTTNENLLSEVYSENGLTIRQHFASLFTASFIQSHQNSNPLMIEENAKLGVAQADALIAEFNKEK